MSMFVDWSISDHDLNVAVGVQDSLTRLEFGGLLYVQQINVKGSTFHLEQPTTGPMPFGYSASSPLITSNGK